MNYEKLKERNKIALENTLRIRESLSRNASHIQHYIIYFLNKDCPKRTKFCHIYRQLKLRHPDVVMIKKNSKHLHDGLDRTVFIKWQQASK